jgi:hypothetical protein
VTVNCRSSFAVAVVALGALTLVIGRRAVGETRVIPELAPALADATP